MVVNQKMKSLSFNNISFVGVCHGETEVVFLRKIFKAYWDYKLDELSIINSNNIGVRCLENNESITVNNFEKIVSKHFSKFVNKKFYPENDFGEHLHIFIIVIDIEEDHSEDKQKREILIVTHASEEIKTILKKYKQKEELGYEKTFHSSFLVWNKKGLEKALNLPYGKNKIDNIRNWLSEQEVKWETSDDIRKTFANCSETSNIMELFDFIDDLIEQIDFDEEEQ